MPISSTVSSDKKRVMISVTERFDYSLHQPFRDAYRQISNAGMIYSLDLSRANYMDSSALGMILLLKEHAEKHGGSVIISKPHPSVEKVLKIANFDRFVTIES